MYRINSLVFAIIFFIFSYPIMAMDWVEFTDVTTTQIQIIDELGVNDTFEKDLLAVDIDNDGDNDIIIVRKVRFSTAGGQANLLVMNESSMMVDRTASLAPGFLDSTDDRDVIAVDVNNDGWKDVITATTFGQVPRVYMNLGNMNGIWQGLSYVASDNRISPFLIPPKFCAVAAGDVNGDNFVDLFFVDYDNGLEDRLLINDGNGFFVDETLTRMTEAMSESVFGTSADIYDMNGDGFKDIIKVSSSGSGPPPGSTEPQVRILYNDGTGNFTDMSVFNNLLPYMMELIDIDNNGEKDIFVVSDGQDKTLMNTGNGVDGKAEFTISDISNSPNTANFGGNTFAIDLNRDGFQDMLVADVDTDIAGCNRNLVALRNNEGASLTDPFNGAPKAWLTRGTFDIAVADFNGDGFNDIWSGTCTGNKLFFQIPIDLIYMHGFE
jgi:hypothetical protein